MEEESELTIETSTQVRQTPKWLMVLLLMVFPPATWYFMWKDKRYHKWFIYLLWLYGVFMIFIPLL